MPGPPLVLVAVVVELGLDPVAPLEALAVEPPPTPEVEELAPSDCGAPAPSAPRLPPPIEPVHAHSPTASKADATCFVMLQ